MAKTKDPELRRFIHDQHDTYFSRFSDRDVLRDAFVASVSHDVREFAPEIDVPTLLVAAERDDITPIEAERKLAKIFPDASLVEIAHVGHLIHYETPAEAAGAIRRFLRFPSREADESATRNGITSPIASEVSVRSTPSIDRIRASVSKRWRASRQATRASRSIDPLRPCACTTSGIRASSLMMRGARSVARRMLTNACNGNPSTSVENDRSYDRKIPLCSKRAIRA